MATTMEPTQLAEQIHAELALATPEHVIGMLNHWVSMKETANPMIYKAVLKMMAQSLYLKTLLPG